MPTIVPKPIVLNDIVLRIGADNYEATVNRATFTPNTPTAVWKGMTPNSSINLVGEPDWTLDLQFAQDFETAKSLSRYSMENRGKPVECTLLPKSGGAGYKATAVPVPGVIGGDLGGANAATAAVQWPVNGQPAPVAAGA